MTLNTQGLFEEKVIEVQHYTDRLFRFRITRPQSFRFRSGEFVMVGLMVEGKPLVRAYSVASPSWDESLEFYSIKVPEGPLTSRLQNIKVGDTLVMRPKTTGTLVLDALLPGKRLFMISTGTGFAPFASVIRDPETYEKFEQAIVIHTCREKAELQYGYDTVAVAKDDPLVGEQAQKQLLHFASTTREPTDNMGRITALVENGEFFKRMGIEPFNPEHDRAMLCGSMAMIKDVKAMLEKHGFVEGSNADPATFVVERAFVG
jgi:ferredoxin--NADP+ reductase